MSTSRRDVLDRIRPHLADRYEFAEPMGSGGMATVYRARDLRHHRDVAIKVLHPELAASLIADRFVREIGIAAQFTHPHIVPVFDSGEADGIPFYVMPVIEGETLRARLLRETTLGSRDAIQIAREVADALDYAHARGVVHRDIKPENILLNSGHAIVADFGIARAIDAAAVAGDITAGIVVGSPHYMSPEQGTAPRTVDGRSDIYSLGCVLHEMLAGARPFKGDSPREVVAAKLSKAPAPLPASVGELPSGVRDAVARALARDPDERFTTAREFADALAGAPGSGASPRRGRGLALVVAGFAAAVVLIVSMKSRQPDSVASADATRIAVFPFDVTGDSSQSYLREGMAELVATRLGALDGVRPLDPRITIAEWRNQVRGSAGVTPTAATGIARALGTDRFVLGTIVVSAGRLSVSATLHDANAAPHQATADGPADSLFALVDRVSVGLIASREGEPEQRIAMLTSTSLPAVRAYLTGREAWRRGEINRAIRGYSTALEIDSTFALAALGMASSGEWSQQGSQAEALRRGLRTGYALRNRLSKRDRLLFEAYVLPENPAGLVARRQLDAWEEAATAAPDSPEAQYEYGDRLYHSGAQTGVADAGAIAVSAFERTIALDAGNAGAAAHLAEIFALQGRAQEAAAMRDRHQRLAPGAEVGPYVRWRVASAATMNGSVLPTRRDSIPLFSLNRILGFGLLEGRALADVDSAAAELQRRLNSRSLGPTRVHPAQTMHNWAANRGREDGVRYAYDLLRASEPIAPGTTLVYPDADIAPVLDALFWDGDSAVARTAVDRLRSRVMKPPPAAPPERARYFSDLCTTLLWSLLRGEQREERQQRAYLRSGTEPNESSIQFGGGPRLCGAMIEAIGSRPDDASPLARLDSMMVSAPFQFGVDFGNLIVSRLMERRNDVNGALRAVRRRPYDWDTGPLYLTTYLREEGRLAARTGDRAGAIRAYSAYLTLREGSGPQFRAADDAVRRDLATLRP